MRQYGYIANNEIHECKEADVHWEFSRNGVDYIGIESSIDLTLDSNVIIIGDAKDFRKWLNEFPPPDEPINDEI